MGLSHVDPAVHRWLTPGAVARATPVAFAAAVVALQIAYPLVAQGPARDRLTVLIVLCFAVASLSHALVTRGAAFTLALVATTTVGGLAVEVLGVSTGVPFGQYRYAGSLGVQVFGVPVVVALAWTMMAYPAYVVSERIGGGLFRRIVVGGWALASWDLFLDPQMVQAGHWEWSTHGPALAGIPLTNYLAWFVVASAMMAGLRALAPSQPASGVDDRVPLTLYVWTYASSVLAHAAFFGLPMSAAAGGIGMGVVVAALVLRAQADAAARPVRVTAGSRQRAPAAMPADRERPRGR